MYGRRSNLHDALREIRGYPTLRSASGCSTASRCSAACMSLISAISTAPIARSTTTAAAPVARRPHPLADPDPRSRHAPRGAGRRRAADASRHRRGRSRRAKQLGLLTSLTTNGFLLTRTLVKDLEAAGLEVMQISVDRMTPSAITRKSFKTVLPKLETSGWIVDQSAHHRRAVRRHDG